jgi:hypothetical protein
VTLGRSQAALREPVVVVLWGVLRADAVCVTDAARDDLPIGVQAMTLPILCLGARLATRPTDENSTDFSRLGRVMR